MPKTVDDLNTRQTELLESKKKIPCPETAQSHAVYDLLPPATLAQLMLKGGRKAAQVGCIHTGRGTTPIHTEGRVDITRH
jgi:hypothetical protein